MVKSPQIAAPSAGSPSIGLVEQGQAERNCIWASNASEFRGPLSVEDYVDREKFLSKQLLTSNGGITFWALTDLAMPVTQRPLLSSCETIKKRALVKCPGQQVQDAVVYGIASVFCKPEYRGRGYASTMMKLLGPRLDEPNEQAEFGSMFTVLYSDIGKNFYNKHGWKPHRSAHINLKPSSCAQTPQVQELYSHDVEALCGKDENLLREALDRSNAHQVQVLLVPDHMTLAWLHAREEFVAGRLSKEQPRVKGVRFAFSDGRHAWCLWSRFFSNDPASNTLHVLRIAVEGDEFGDAAAHEETRNAIILLLKAAQNQAVEWALDQVQIWYVSRSRPRIAPEGLWNCSLLILAVAQDIQPNIRVVHRDAESIASLRLNPRTGLSEPVDWLVNEKFGWC